MAEDVELNQFLARHFLQSSGYEVTVAANGHEALARLEDRSYDCILMDIQMPELDGIQTARRIRGLTDPQKAAIPIIALTANVRQEDIARYRAAGMNDFLAKPFDEASLLLVISRNLDPTLPVSSPGQAIEMHDRSPGEETCLYDLSIVQSVSGGDRAFIRKMILLFIETVPVNVGELSAALVAENWEQVGKMAHKLKSTVDSMGIKSIHGDIRKVEAYAKEKKNLEEIAGMTAKIHDTIERCIRQLRGELA